MQRQRDQDSNGTRCCNNNCDSHTNEPNTLTLTIKLDDILCCIFINTSGVGDAETEL